MPTAPGPPASTPSDRTPERPHAAPWVWASACLSLCAALFALVATGWRPLLDLDDAVARVLHRSALAHPGWTETARVFTDWVWDTVTMRALIAVAVVVLWRKRERALALLLAVTMLLGVLVQQGLKTLLGRERPEWQNPLDTAHYAAMPSGHAMTAALACSLLTWLAWTRPHRAATRRAVAAAAVVSVAGVSATRVYLGVHWLTDVVAGAALGTAMAALAAGSWQILHRPEKITP